MNTKILRYVVKHNQQNFVRKLDPSYLQPMNWAVNRGIKKSGSTDAVGRYTMILDKMRKNWPQACALFISGFYIQQTLTSNIPKERKTTLTINNIITALVGFLGGLGLNKVVDSTADKIVSGLKKHYASVESKERKLIIDGAKFAMPILCSTLAFRYLSPVIATPLADVTTKALVKARIIPDPETGKKITDEKLAALKLADQEAKEQKLAAKKLNVVR